MVDRNFLHRITSLKVLHTERRYEHRVGSNTMEFGFAFLRTRAQRKHGIESLAFHIFLGLARNQYPITRNDFPTIGIVARLDILFGARLHVHGDTHGIFRIDVHFGLVRIGKVHRQYLLTGTGIYIGHIFETFAIESSQQLGSQHDIARCRLGRGSITNGKGDFSLPRGTGSCIVHGYETSHGVDRHHRIESG